MSQVIYDNLTLDQFLKLPETKPPLEYVQGKVVQKWDDPVIYQGLSLKGFLRLPEAKPALEYIDGKVVQKVSPNRSHSLLQVMLGARILETARPRSLGLPYTELRCTFGGRSIVPDLSFIARGRIARDKEGNRVEDIGFPPDLIIEILSPGQIAKNLSARLAWCVQNGVRLAWLIQAARRIVYVFRPGQPRQVLGIGDVLSGLDVLPAFALDLTELFEWLSED